MTTVEKLLRISLATVYVWFGILKPFGLSPADGLVEQTLGWTSIPHLVTVLGLCELALGVMFLVPRVTKITLVLFFIHMTGTFFPLVILPDISFGSDPLVLSLIGQYIIKNLVFVAAGYALWHLHNKTITLDSSRNDS